MNDHTEQPLTGQARLVRNIIKHLTADDVATLVADPPGNRAKEMSYVQIHAMVTGYAADVDKARWEDLLIDAAGVERKPEWSLTWATPIAKLLGICVEPAKPEAQPAKAKKVPAEVDAAKKAPAEVDAPVVGLGETRQAAA